MPVRRVQSHPEVENNRGKLALQRGPMVYAAEAVDHGGRVFDLALPQDTELTADYRDDLLGGVVALAGTARRGGREVAVPRDSLFQLGEPWPGRDGGVDSLRAPADEPLKRYAVRSRSPRRTGPRICRIGCFRVAPAEDRDGASASASRDLRPVDPARRVPADERSRPAGRCPRSRARMRSSSRATGASAHPRRGALETIAAREEVKERPRAKMLVYRMGCRVASRDTSPRASTLVAESDVSPIALEKIDSANRVRETMEVLLLELGGSEVREIPVEIGPGKFSEHSISHESAHPHRAVVRSRDFVRDSGVDTPERELLGNRRRSRGSPPADRGGREGDFARRRRGHLIHDAAGGADDSSSRPSGKGGPPPGARVRDRRRRRRPSSSPLRAPRRMRPLCPRARSIRYRMRAPSAKDRAFLAGENHESPRDIGRPAAVEVRVARLRRIVRSSAKATVRLADLARGPGAFDG